MSEGNGTTETGKTSYNIIKTRGDPNWAITLSGHRVEKQEFVVIPNPLDPAGYESMPVMIKCADYHNEHFVYIDPLFKRDLPETETRQFWFAMCTCGAPAGLIGGRDVAIHEGSDWDGMVENMIVCQVYFQNLLQYGHGFHVGQDPRPWR